ncbi:MAG: LptF/LptG family permease, partial [Bacteroidetes bacterium]|nr:LptF/LptG family permease [Bacteroidota bacterium]
HRFLKPYFVLYRDSVIEDAPTEHLATAREKYAEQVDALTATQLVEKATSQARSVRNRLQSLETEIDYLRYRKLRGQIEWNRKFTMSLAALLMFFIGAPLGALIRKGGLGLPVVISTVLFVLFYILMIGMERASKQYVITAGMGMWVPVLILLPIGLWLTYLSNKDAKLIRLGSWVSAKISNFKKKRVA